MTTKRRTILLELDLAVDDVTPPGAIDAALPAVLEYSTAKEAIDTGLYGARDAIVCDVLALRVATIQPERANLKDADRRLTLEGELLAVVSAHGGERILAGPSMSALIRELADAVEARPGLAVARDRLSGIAQYQAESR